LAFDSQLKNRIVILHNSHHDFVLTLKNKALSIRISKIGVEHR